MEGYVYIARIIDHGGKFVNGYHKIGLSKQYKVRETQLNSTHLPFDVLMIRVFETEDMNRLEGILHVCFDDYRVVKEYDYRRNITTEWFDVSDIDMFNERLDKLIDLMSVDEIDMGRSIDEDSSLTQEEKERVKENVEKGSGVIRQEKRNGFWTKLLGDYKQIDNLYDNISPGKQPFLSKRLSGVGVFNFVATGKNIQVELYIGLFGKEDNKMMYDKIHQYKSEIETEFGDELLWERRDHGKSSRISFRGNGNVYDDTCWDDMSEFLCHNMVKFSKVIIKHTQNI